MSDKQLTEYYSVYVSEKTSDGTMISVANFKRYLLSQGVTISSIYKLDSWSRVRDELDIYYEDYLLAKAGAGGRNSQTFTTLLNKFYEKQARTGAEQDTVVVKLDIINSGKNKI